MKKQYQAVGILELKALSETKLGLVHYNAERTDREVVLIPGKEILTILDIEHYARQEFSWEALEKVYPQEFYIKLEEGFTVKTPHGYLHACAAGNEQEPGIEIYLLQPQQPEVLLVHTEYWEDGNEIIDPYVSTHGTATLQEKQRNEVPDVRIKKNDQGEEVLTAGIVTRVIPNDMTEDHLSERVFHFGYQEVL